MGGSPGKKKPNLAEVSPSSAQKKYSRSLHGQGGWELPTGRMFHFGREILLHVLSNPAPNKGARAIGSLGGKQVDSEEEREGKKKKVGRSRMGCLTS